MTSSVSRFEWLDSAWAGEMVQYWTDQLAITNSASPSMIAWRADIETMIAGLQYAIGVPLDQVGRHIAEAARGNYHLFVTKADADPSLRNSRQGILALALNAIAGNIDRLNEIARAISDRPGASWVGENSEICTPQDQQAAALLRSEILQIPLPGWALQMPERSGISIFSLRCRLAFALIQRDGAAFRTALDACLEWYERSFEDSNMRKKPELFLALPELGISAIAIQRGFIALPDLPADSVPFPVGLLKN